MPRKEYSHIMPHWVNARQSNEERRKKYQDAVKNGVPTHIARCIRDWTNDHYKLFLDCRRDFL